MMNRAGRLHGLRTLGVVAGLVTLVLLGLDIRRRVVEANREAVATGLVDQVVRANIAQVPENREGNGGIPPLGRSRPTSSDRAISERSLERLHAGLALLPVDDGQVEYLFRRRLPGRQRRAKYRSYVMPWSRTEPSLTPKLWSVLDSAKPGDAKPSPGGEQPGPLQSRRALAGTRSVPRWLKNWLPPIWSI